MPSLDGLQLSSAQHMIVWANFVPQVIWQEDLNKICLALPTALGSDIDLYFCSTELTQSHRCTVASRRHDLSVHTHVCTLSLSHQDAPNFGANEAEIEKAVSDGNYKEDCVLTSSEHSVPRCQGLETAREV